MSCARALGLAVAQAHGRTETADLYKGCTAQALSCAEAEAVARENQPSNDSESARAIGLSETPTDQLSAELPWHGFSVRK